MTNSFKDKWIEYIHDLQNKICDGLSNEDGKAKFIEDLWERPEGGGGKTRVITNGNVFEKGGVNTSVVSGDVTDTMRKQLGIDGDKWFACGLSLVIHPKNPYVPTVHANWRYFELYDKDGNIIDQWFGGGSDLTPYYLFEEDVKHFHQTLKNVIDPFGSDLHKRYKKWCDEYFSNTHRNNETRGVGGVFYDHLNPTPSFDIEKLFAFQQANGNAFLQGYLPIVNKRKNTAYGEREINWQEIRRGRYVEFNLIHDRGTIFGLKTGGRTESILMSLPPRARWAYDYTPEKGTEEDKLLQICLHPKDWTTIDIDENEWARKANSC
ncbi:oxygen-dependent coproporphyrinogen oxidase [Ferruginibacter sp. SUN002]|uniref:oxygen-dependent coproporphyrinogen oxidase n=1 Tax=Ferruginibacter sp. SUN002 TaxID=2937789 RepID=UPI003D369DC2